MPKSRAPRQLLTSLVAHSRPIGCPQMTWGRTLENALSSKGISKELEKSIAIAKDRPNGDSRLTPNQNLLMPDG